jgi:hypothetical protein
MFNKGALGNMMKQAQLMQDNIKKAQDELATVEVEGQASSGMVKAVITCSGTVKRISIDDSLMGDDKEMLEDLIVTALNDAQKKAEATTQGRMAKATAGMPLPPGMKLPF